MAKVAWTTGMVSAIAEGGICVVLGPLYGGLAAREGVGC